MTEYLEESKCQVAGGARYAWAKGPVPSVDFAQELASTVTDTARHIM